jgi:hypothetical protein
MDSFPASFSEFLLPGKASMLHNPGSVALPVAVKHGGS